MEDSNLLQVDTSSAHKTTREKNASNQQPERDPKGKSGDGRRATIEISVPRGAPAAAVPSAPVPELREAEPDVVLSRREIVGRVAKLPQRGHQLAREQPLEVVKLGGHLRAHVDRGVWALGIDGAEVAIVELDLFGNTDFWGNCDFSDVPVGTCTVQVRWRGRKEIKKITVRPGRSVTVRFHVNEWSDVDA